jgi:protein gp37
MAISHIEWTDAIWSPAASIATWRPGSVWNERKVYVVPKAREDEERVNREDVKKKRRTHKAA